MQTPDFINGSFELIGGALTCLSIRKLRQDKQVHGVSLWPSLFFTVWGGWNCFYYPMLGQFFSFIGGLGVLSANICWLILAFMYSRRKF